MHPAPERGTRIGRLRVHAAARDAADLRMRSESVLRSCDLEPACLPPHAILCVRSFRDPLPGTLDLRARDAASRAQWERAVRASLESLARRAFRVESGSVPPDADAVVFLDRAELLACAAQDAVHGVLPRQWWWPQLLADVHAGLAPVIREWMREPRWIPAAIALLARRRADLIAVVTAIPREEARRIVEAVLYAHGLPALARAVVAALEERTGHRVQSAERRRRTHPRHAVRWLAVVPEASEPLPLAIEQQLLVAIPLLLQRAPAIVRAPSFETAIVRWIAPRREVARRAIATRSDEPVATPQPSRTSQSTASHRTRSAARPSTLRRNAHRRDAGATAGVTPAVRRGSPQERDSALLHISPAPRPLPTAPCPLPSAHSFDSSFAGSFFLLNFGIALGFYSDFTSPVQQGIGLDIFLFVDRLARALAGRAFARDPIHAFLQRPAPRWKPPAVLHAYPGAPRRDLWIAAVANHLRLRIGEPLARQLVSLPGRVAVSPLHLDVYFSLNIHPIEIRIAGLDRDPGWIPAAGRHVAFHFD